MRTYTSGDEFNTLSLKVRGLPTYKVTDGLNNKLGDYCTLTKLKEEMSQIGNQIDEIKLK